MAKDVKIAGATYPAVPAILVSTPTGGTAVFVDEDEIDYVTIYKRSEDPSPSLGKDGDIYLQK